MKLRVVFESEAKPRIELVAENEGEQKLIGAVFSTSCIGNVTLRFNGHPLNKCVEVMCLTVSDGKP